MPAPRDSFWVHLRRNVQMVSFAAIVLVILASVGFGFFLRGQRLMETQLRDELRTLATVAVRQFDAATVEKIDGPETMETPAFREIVEQLQFIEKDIPGIRFAYLMRRTDDPNTLEFIADASALSTSEELDTNGNGTVDEDEEASFPGDSYDISEVPALQGPAFEMPTVDEEITYDQWGALISAYAPIRDVDGKVVAIFGIDMQATDFINFTNRLFSPVAFLLFLFGSLIFTIYILTFVWRRRMEVLRQLDEERRGIMLLASHQLGTPLTIFKWSLESLQDSQARKCLGEESFREHMANMQEGIARLQNILDELKEATTVEQGKITYRPQQVRLSELIVHLVQTSKPYFEQRQQHLRLDLDDNLSLNLDPHLMTAVLHELLDNAWTYSKPGSTTTVITRTRKGFAEIEIRDEGCGITPVDQRKIFEKFYRGTNAYAFKPDGAGLGLFVARGVVEKAGGSIWIKSEPNKGSSVFISLPLSQPGSATV